jgi:alpha-mannosidase
VAGAGEDAVGDGEDAPEAGTGAVTATTTALRNRDLRVGIDTATGALVSIVDAVARREYLGPGGVYPVVIDDRSDTWSHGVDRYDGHEQPGRLLDLRVVETGPVRATVMIELAWGTSLVAQEVSVYADRPFVELRYRVDWHATERILKLVIPVLVADASTIAGIPYGWIARPPHGHEEVMQRWVDVSGRPSGPSGPGPVSGLGCTTDCKFAYDVLASRLRVTALRSPRYADHGMGWAGTDDRSYPVTDQGVQRFSVRLHPHAGGAVDAGLARLAEEHLVEPPVVVDAPHPGPLPPFSSGLSVDAGTVAVSVAKRAERGDGTVLRIHELDGRPTLATLALTAWGRRWEGPLGAHEVKTLYLPDRPDLPVREIDVTELWTD